jgi:hypothetical protein
MMKRAWRTSVIGITSIVAAHSRGKAIAITADQAREAGFEVAFTDVVAARAAEHDAWAEVDETNKCWDEKLLPKAPPLDDLPGHDGG